MASNMVNIKFKVDSQGAKKGMKDLAKSMKSSARGADEWAKAGFFASAGAAAFKVSIKVLRKAITSLIGPIKDSIFEIGTLGDRIAKQARMIGVTAEEFQVLEFAATRSGTSVTAVANGMKKLGRVMVDAQSQGATGQIARTFEALGIELKKSDGTLRNSLDVFKDLADKSMILGESAERTGIQMLLLGRSGTELANLMSNGAKGIEDMKDELAALGAIMDESKTAMGEDFVDRMADLEFAFRGVKIELGDNLLPEFISFVEEFNKWLAASDFSRVRELADSFFDVAMGAARAADEMLNLRLFEPGEEDRLQLIANRTDEITRRIQTGTATLDDYRRAQDELGASTGASDGEMMRWGASLESGGAKLGDFVTNLEDLSYGQLPYVNAELLTMKDAFQVTGEQVASFSSLLDSGVGVEAATKAMKNLGEATAGQAMMLRFLHQTWGEDIAINEKLSEVRAGRIEEGKREAALAERRAAQIEKERTALRRKIANLGLGTKATNKSTEADRKKAQALKEVLEQEKALVAWYARRAKLDDKYYEEFIKKDPAAISESFMRGLMDEESFRREMAAAAEQQERIERERKSTLLEEWYGKDEKKYEEYLVRKAEIDAAYAAGKIAMDSEANAVVLENQNRQMEAMQGVINSSGQMFGALSNIAMDAYKKGDQEALSHARALFAVQQAMALAGATVSTAQAITNALATPPAPLGIALAVGAGVAGAAQIATIIGTAIQGVGDAGLTSDTLRKAGLNNHSAIAVRNDETILDPVGTRHITEMLEIQKSQMVGASSEQKISTTVEIDGRVLGESVDSYMIRQQERGLAYSNRVRQDYL